MTYPLPSKENSRRIRSEIRRVFLEVWDPIGIKDEPNAQDEYDGYIGEAFELLWRGASDRELIAYLDRIVNRMGMDASHYPLQAIAAELRKIPLSEQAST